MQNTWFVKPKPNASADLRLICFPYAGGSATTFMSWAKLLPANVELVIIQAPGRGVRIAEQAYSNMSALVNDLINVMPALFDKPYVFFGHSLGSRVAFELMSQLYDKHKVLPLHFIASGSRSPNLKATKKPIHHLPDAQFIDELKVLNGTPQVVLDNQELMEMFLPLLRADFEVADTYYYQKKSNFDCPITVLTGVDDDISPDDLQAWGDLFKTNIDLHYITGDHFFIDSHKDIVVEQVNKIISNTLKRLVSLY